MQFRLAGTSDAESIMAVINAAFRNAESFFIDRDRIDAETVSSLMQKGKFLVGENEGTLVACVYLEQRGERTYLGLLSVDPRMQAKGIGSKLMTAAEEECANSGCRSWICGSSTCARRIKLSTAGVDMPSRAPSHFRPN